MTHPDRFEAGLQNFNQLYWGIVKNNKDPEGRGRVKVEVPGLLEPESDWAWTILPGQGAPRRGIFAVPAEGSAVIVGFIQGNSEEPIVLGGITVPETNPVISGLSIEKIPNVFAITMGRFSIVIDSNEDAPRMYLRDEGTLDEGAADEEKDPLLIMLDGAKRAIHIKGQVALVLTSDGLVHIDGVPVRIVKRAVLDNGRVI